VIDTEYAWRKVNAGTELRVTMRYRVSTEGPVREHSAAFNWYTQPNADFLVGNFEEAALRFYAARAEKKAEVVPRLLHRCLPSRQSHQWSRSGFFHCKSLGLERQGSLLDR
jgi:hypothetical protein